MRVAFVSVLMFTTLGCGDGGHIVSTRDSANLATSAGGSLGTGGMANQQGGASNLGGRVATGGSTGSGGRLTGSAVTGNGGNATITGGTSSQGGSATGGAGVNGGAGTTGGSSTTLGDFNPCPPAPTPCAIMALGDSITDGYSASDGGGYRIPLFRLALADHKSITFVGSGNGGPATVEGVPFPTAHEGHSGLAINELMPFVQNASGGNAQIILVMAGTNGCENGEMIVCLENLLNAAFTAAPDALVVAAQVIPTNPDGLAAFNAQIPALVDRLALSGKHVVLADQYHSFLANPEYGAAYLVDYAHPNDVGYKVMADVWYQAIRGFLH